jgi:hypothetical protein
VCLGILASPKGVTCFAERQGWVKIGRTSAHSVAARIRKLAGRVPAVLMPEGMSTTEPLTLLGVIDHDVEHQTHERFATCHVIGEWFRPDEAMTTWMRGAL